MNNNIKFVWTKLKMPMPRRNYIKREDLLKRMKDILDYKVTLIRGAAASGKTTLISSFIIENKINNAKWISLDKDNNDMFSFWFYFLEAIREFLGEEGNKIFEFFDTIINNNDIETLVTMIINSLDIHKEIIIILDDFHYITNKELLKTIEYFIKYSSTNVHIALLSRQQPSLYLGDLIMADELLDISEEELKFSYNESMEFLTKTLKKNLSIELIKRINSAAEGWVGGLQLIALASLNKDIKDVKIINNYMIDYLSNEIINSLSEREREFLIKTSVLSYFNSEITNKLLGIVDSFDIINTLLDKNLFLISIDEEEGIYRYHNIFEEFLRLQFEKLKDEEKYEIHLMASNIYKEKGDLDGCLNHLLCIKEYNKALEIINDIGENPKGWSYLSKIPNEYILEYKGLTLQKFFHHFCNMEISKCRDILELACKRDDFKNLHKVLNFSMNIIEDNYSRNIITLEEIDKLEVSELTKAVLYIVVSAAISNSERYEEADKLLYKVMEIEKHNKNSYIKYFALNIKAQIKEEAGDLIEAEEIYGEIVKMIEKYPSLEKIKANAYIGVIGIYLKGYKMDKAKEYLEKTEKTLYKGYTGMQEGYIYNLIEYKILKGEEREVLELVNRMLAFNKYKNTVYYSDMVNFLMLSHNISREKLIEYVEVYEGEEKHYTRDKVHYCRTLIELNLCNKAKAVVEDVLEVTRKYKVKVELIKAILLKLRLLEADYENNKREILNLMIEAVKYSTSNKIIEPFILEKAVTKKYFTALLNEKSKKLNLKDKSFINEVLNYVEPPKKEEILSEREKEVLSILETGATNKEIGEKLNISLSTVKTHMINIYSKLQVSTRIEALNKAKNLKII